MAHQPPQPSGHQQSSCGPQQPMAFHENGDRSAICFRTTDTADCNLSWGNDMFLSPPTWGCGQSLRMLKKQNVPQISFFCSPHDKDPGSERPSQRSWLPGRRRNNKPPQGCARCHRISSGLKNCQWPTNHQQPFGHQQSSFGPQQPIAFSPEWRPFIGLFSYNRHNKLQSVLGN